MKHLPELVSYDSARGVYGVNNSGVIPILVEAVKELKSENELQNQEIARLKEAVGLGDTPTSYLNQVDPAPYDSPVEISFNLETGTQTADIFIYDMQGSQLMRMGVTNPSSETSVTIEASTLSAGMYMYTLIADGKEADTKKMILTEL